MTVTKCFMAVYGDGRVFGKFRTFEAAADYIQYQQSQTTGYTFENAFSIVEGYVIDIP